MNYSYAYTDTGLNYKQRQTDIFITREELILYDDWRKWDAMRRGYPRTRLFWTMLMFATSLTVTSLPTALEFYFRMQSIYDVRYRVLALS